MSHPNATLTPTGRTLLARCIVEDGWSLRRAAERFQVSTGTANRWATRYREHGAAGMHDRSSRPHASPQRTCTRTERRIIALRVNRRWGPARIGYHLGIRRYEHKAPGDMIHVDIKKLGRIPDGGGHQALGRAAGNRNKTRTIANRRPGYAYLSRLAYTEILTDEKKDTAAGFWERANAYFASLGITVRQVLTDNGACYRSHAFRDALGVAVKHRRTRPYRPQTNGKVERFNRTMLEEWAYARPYRTEAERVAAFQGWLDYYNYRRGHTALKGLAPADRVLNLRG